MLYEGMKILKCVQNVFRGVLRIWAGVESKQSE